MSDQLKIEEYSNKAFVVRGNSKPYKEQFTSRHGRWNSNLKGGSGWIFSNRHIKNIKLFVNDINNNNVTKLPKKRKHTENTNFYYNKKFRKQIIDELDERFRIEYDIKNYTSSIIAKTKTKSKSNLVFKFILIFILFTLLISFPTKNNIFFLEYSKQIVININCTLHNIYNSLFGI